MPGNRAIAAGAEIDYALAARRWRGGRIARARRRTTAGGAGTAAAGLQGHRHRHAPRGARLQGRRRWPAWSARIRCAVAATITTRRCCSAISSPPRRARASSTSRPATARTISTSAARMAWRSPKPSAMTAPSIAWVPLFAGVHVYKAADPVCAALDEAGGLLARGKLVHSYPHSWRSKAPLIFRATPQWFIRMDGPEHIREKALAAIDATRVRAGSGAQPHRPHGRRAAGLVHQPPARLGRADPGVRGQAAPASCCAIRPWCAHRRGVRRPRARTPGTPRRRRASSAMNATPTTTSR